MGQPGFEPGSSGIQEGSRYFLQTKFASRLPSPKPERLPDYPIAPLKKELKVIYKIISFLSEPFP